MIEMQIGDAVVKIKAAAPPGRLSFARVAIVAMTGTLPAEPSPRELWRAAMALNTDEATSMLTRSYFTGSHPITWRSFTANDVARALEGARSKTHNGIMT